MNTEDELEHQKKKTKWSRSVRKERKLNLHKGLPFVSSSGKSIAGRQIQPLKKCRKMCQTFLTDDVRSKIFSEYWSLGTHDRRLSFLSGLINSTEKKCSRTRKFDSNKNRTLTLNNFFEINGQRHSVCKDCFLKTLDEKEGFIRSVTKNKGLNISGIVNLDKRGKKSPKNKISDDRLAKVIEHINSFPSYESHYTRKLNDKKYLPSNLNLQKMYELYKQTIDGPVSRVIYEREFHKLKLAFKKPSVDTCHKCDVLQMQIKVAEETNHEENLLASKNSLNLHQSAADLAYSSKANDKVIAKNDSTKKCFSFDLQQCLPTPFLQSSVVFYKRQLWTFNLTIHDNCTGKSFNYMWHEGIAGRGANEIASCLYYHLKHNIQPNESEITFYSDTCGGQNKNTYVSAMFLKAIQELPNIKIINHKFLVAGHTHMECDIDHSMIEKSKKKSNTPIYHPHDWYQLVRRTGKVSKFQVVEMSQTDFFDFSNLLKGPLMVHKLNTDREQFKWQPVSWLQYTKTGKGVLNYKTTLEENAPFKILSFLRRGNSGSILQVKKNTMDL